MLKYKIDIIEELKKIGVTSANVKDSGIFGQATMKKFKNKDTSITLESLNRLCFLLEMQPRDIIKFVETEDDEKKYLKNLKKGIDNH